MPGQTSVHSLSDAGGPDAQPSDQQEGQVGNDIPEVGDAEELTRRVAGLIIPGLIILALTYVAFWGKYVGGVFAFPGLSLETVAFRSIFGDDATEGRV